MLKEKQIESSREQISHRAKVSEKQMQKINANQEEIERKNSKINQLIHELNQQKAATKDKEKTIFKIVSDINNIA